MLKFRRTTWDPPGRASWDLKRGGQAYICDTVINHFWCSWIVINWKTTLWIVTEVDSVKHELPKSLIVYTYIEDQLKKINRYFGQTTFTILWWLDLTSLLSLLM